MFSVDTSTCELKKIAAAGAAEFSSIYGLFFLCFSITILVADHFNSAPTFGENTALIDSHQTPLTCGEKAILGKAIRLEMTDLMRRPVPNL